MNIEQTQKMNFMVRELTKSGIVSNFDDAVTMASDLYTNGSPSTVQSSESSTVAESTPETAKTTSDFSDFERIAERKANNAVQNYALELQKELTSLKQEIESLKLQLKNQVSAPAPSQPTQVFQPREEPVQQQAQKQLRTETKEAHPRQGNNSPDNIELEDFFYYGTK